MKDCRQIAHTTDMALALAALWLPFFGAFFSRFFALAVADF